MCKYLKDKLLDHLETWLWDNLSDDWGLRIEIWIYYASVGWLEQGGFDIPFLSELLPFF